MPRAAYVDTQRTALFALLEQLHRQKDAAYGDAWRKRGEVIAIFANMARKYDRLLVAFDEQRAAAAEPLADTVGDLCVYAGKYLTWIAEEHPEAIAAAEVALPQQPEISAARGPDALRAIFAAVSGRPASAPTIAQAWARVRSSFESLEAGLLALATPDGAEPPLSFPAKVRLADALVESTVDLLAALERDDPATLDALRSEVRTMERTAAGA